ncbi:hypothetical protein AB0G02_33860 [Actinosynnema sp. NPDC023658]|uniref:hypothetical protein n=1 Tax=Actinosynnema sp. NPDC023658 TaxID=3155465 RepID=UPI0033F99FA6
MSADVEDRDDEVEGDEPETAARNRDDVADDSADEDSDDDSDEAGDATAEAAGERAPGGIASAVVEPGDVEAAVGSGEAGSGEAGSGEAGSGEAGSGEAGSGEGEAEERVFTRARTPELPDDADISILDPEVKQELRGLPKGLAEIVGRHLAAAGMLIDSEPELALEHARYARSKAARVAVVREAAGLTAYHAGEWAEALSELRAARRMSHGAGHLAVMADCERALGRPERAIELAREAQGVQLAPDEAVELRIVAAGARRDMGQLDAAVVALQGDDLDEKRREPWSARLFYAYADNLEAAGRTEEAVKWFLNAAQADDDNETDAAERAFDLSPQD